MRAETKDRLVLLSFDLLIKLLFGLSYDSYCIPVSSLPWKLPLLGILLKARLSRTAFSSIVDVRLWVFTAIYSGSSLESAHAATF